MVGGLVVLAGPALAADAVSLTPALDSPFGAGGSPQFVSSEDLNDDGAQDLAVANHESDIVSVLLGDGTGDFGEALPFSVGDGPTSITSEDFDGDGDRDLAVANS